MIDHHAVDPCDVKAIVEVCKWPALCSFLHAVIVAELINSVNSGFSSIVVQYHIRQTCFFINFVVMVHS